MAISDDYTIRQYQETILNFSETERLNLFLRVAGLCQPDVDITSTTVLELFMLMDHPGKDFIWHRGHRSSSVFVVEDMDSIKRLWIEPSDGLWFEFYLSPATDHWVVAEVNKGYAQLAVNPDKLYVMPDKDEE